MGVVITLTPQELVLALTGAMGLGALALGLLYKALKPKHEVREDLSTEPYLSGEGEEVVTEVTAPSPGLFWGFVSGWGKKLYGYLRERMHNGILSDWGSYMASWMCIASLVAAAAIIGYLIWGG